MQLRLVFRIHTSPRCIWDMCGNFYYKRIIIFNFAGPVNLGSVQRWLKRLKNRVYRVLTCSVTYLHDHWRPPDGWKPPFVLQKVPIFFLSGQNNFLIYMKVDVDLGSFWRVCVCAKCCLGAVRESSLMPLKALVYVLVGLNQLCALLRPCPKNFKKMFFTFLAWPKSRFAADC